MKRLFQFTILTALITISINTYSQISVTSYSVYALGVNTNQNKKISGELKTFANRHMEDVLMEIDGFYNFKASDYHRFSIGLGLNLTPFGVNDLVNLISFPVQLEIFPLQELKKLSLVFELAPEDVIEGDFYLRTLWGIRYTFGE